MGPRWHWACMGGSMGEPTHGWFMVHNPMNKWMNGYKYGGTFIYGWLIYGKFRLNWIMKGATTISGKLHMATAFDTAIRKHRKRC